MDFDIPQPSLAGRILCCPTRPSKIKEGSFWEEPERFDAEWLKQFVRIALDVAEGVPDNASIQGLEAGMPHTVNELAQAIKAELHEKGVYWKHQVQELATLDDGSAHLIHSKLESHHSVADAMATHYQRKTSEMHLAPRDKQSCCGFEFSQFVRYRARMQHA